MRQKIEINQKIEELVTVYKSAPTQQGIGADFDFDTAFAEGLTPEQFMEDMFRRIAKWDWGK